MPKRKDLNKILIIGAGPIMIGQACEFDYSGTQACKSLKEENYKVILINSNPATIMTDPNLADATYVEPITEEIIEKILKKERPQALLPTLAGQTGLNMALNLYKSGILDKYQVEIIGVKISSIEKAEDRQIFRESMKRINIPINRSQIANNFDEGCSIAKNIGFPIVIRPSFTLGGSGGSLVSNLEEFKKKLDSGLKASPAHRVLLEKSLLGWKEFELELMRDYKGNVIVVCSIENLDPVGIHTGDSITIAPQQTLSDKEYQNMRDMSLKIIKEIGVEGGGANIQFAVNPKNGEIIVIEMNPRVSRSSALASKATGYPIAKVSVKLAVGYSLDEIPNYITKKTKASFEPTLDYCVVKIPRWDFEKFSRSNKLLTVQMKSIGEVMGIGRTFKEAFQKALRSLEIGKFGFENELYFKHSSKDLSDVEKQRLLENVKSKLSMFEFMQFFYIKDAIDLELDINSIYKFTKIDKWFLYQFKELCEFEKELKKPLSFYESNLFKKAKQYGFSDKQISFFSNSSEKKVRKKRKLLNIIPTYKLVDTCAAEFESETPYFYSTYEEEDEAFPSNKKKIMILGGGPNRIGQGLEFDYLCVQCSYALREVGYETIMVNSNPETVSTDYDSSDKLYFEPLTIEDILNIYDKEKPFGIIIQLGGQTPLNLAKDLEDYGVNIIGTSPSSIDLVENRSKFKNLLTNLSYLRLQPINDIANNPSELLEKVNKIGYPVVFRPSYVLGGKSMEIIYNNDQLTDYLEHLKSGKITYPILIDEFLQNAIEVDVDAISDSNNTEICGIMEHIEEAGIHSGDSACVIPPFSLNDLVIKELERYTFFIAKQLKVKGFLNIQFAIKNNKIYFIEVNLRGSRSLPFVSKSTGIEWAKIASHIMLGKMISELNIIRKSYNHVSVKEVVLPFIKFPNEDAILGPEMKSTGEVMGVDKNFGGAFSKAQIAAGNSLPKSGLIFISIDNYNKNRIIEPCKILFNLGFFFGATKNTQKLLLKNNIETIYIHKINEGSPNLIEYLRKGQVHLIVNTPNNRKAIDDGKYIRQAAIQHRIPLVTTITGFIAATNGIKNSFHNKLEIFSLQELFKLS